ncbi:MAG TPA: AbiEi antitoxin N-terminal domain-containing protein, partial [Pseudobdellovibrionaceae bacterium]
MGVGITNKLNILLNEWPVGEIYSTALLHKKGYSDQQIKNYLDAGWIERLGIGAYKKANDQIEWPAGLLVLQEQLKLPVHIGGKAALALLGKSQYLELGEINLILYGPKND